REQAERMASPPPTAAGQDGPISGLHARILRHGDDSRTLRACGRWSRRSASAFADVTVDRFRARDLARWRQEKMGDSRVQVTVKADVVRLDDVDVLRQGSVVRRGRRTAFTGSPCAP